MKNLVGDKLLPVQKRDKLLTQLKAVVEELKPYGIILDKDSRKRTLRPRRGAEAQMQRVHDLALKHGVSLKNISLDGMASDLHSVAAHRAHRRSGGSGLRRGVMPCHRDRRDGAADVRPLPPRALTSPASLW